MNPNFFIVGGAKCGTTNMSYHLMEHKHVFMPKLNEPYYFCRLDVPNDFQRNSMIKDKTKYLDLFKNAKNCKAAGEATSAYLHCPHAPADIKEHFPDAKIIILIRNPIDRAHSAYFSYQFMHPDQRSFGEMIEDHENKIKKEEFFLYSILDPGFYSKHIKKFQSVFPPEQIKIIVFEEYIKNVESTIKSILNFLDLDTNITLREQKKGAYRVPKNKISDKLLKNSGFRNIATKIIPTVYRQKIGDKFLVKQTKKPSMLSQERKKLEGIYESEINELQNLLNRKLPWKDFQ
jgi:hypothetical protein